MRVENVPSAETGMLIRRPVREVFEAFVDPTITTRFWFSTSTGRLELDKPVRWDWHAYGFRVHVRVKALEQDQRIVLEWSAFGAPTQVELTFFAPDDGATFVAVKSSGFRGDGDRVVQQAIDATEGFALVLAGLKALLEHRVELNLGADRFPDRLGRAAKTPAGLRAITG